MNYYTTTFTANTDTVINAINYQIIISDNDEVYLRRDSLNRVYAHYGNSISDSFENLLYDFSKQTGDTFNMYGWMTVIVTSTDTVFWGKPRKRMMIEQGDTISPSKPIRMRGGHRHVKQLFFAANVSKRNTGKFLIQCFMLY